MRYAHLGRSGLSVSRLCLGTMNFSWTTEKADAFTVMDSAHDKGINFFDTANRYGRPTPGVTESILGEWFSQGGGRRDKTVLATKLYGDMGDWPNEGKLSALNIRRALDASLYASRRITSTSISSTISTATRRGMRSGRRWKSRCSRAKSSTPAVRTLRAGISPRPRQRQTSGTTPDWSPSSRSTI